ncbi:MULTISPECIES: DUF4292 domain-containing protein [Dysgonomonas]|uniref:DUF4292 domain-containing protein n=1 Tax=Dysgonomonas gadei ATCC BAA-286 TaxID=742766 RepID=F5J1Y6_9BACT|nr:MULTISPECIES: DUF4292 domain-containing protein [Dysgonomonas]EGK00242.1 hypothetical protein HMPREF9455_03381 [Dysgonomonas gadei ATCC BAA-286]MBF0650703.1 DUF4292 domain-containing protein [Dysgonomonas sp. GY75]
MRLNGLNKIAVLLFIISALFAGSSCKSKKIITTGGTLEEKSHNRIIEDALFSEVKFKTLTTKGNVEFKAGNSSQKVPAVFKMVKDSILQVSIRIPILGGEAMRLTITPDSIFMVDRMKKQYIAERFKDSKAIAGFDFNFYNLQALFTNKLFIPGNREVTEKDFQKYDISSANDVYMLKTKGKGDLLYNFAVDATNHVASTLIYNEKKKITLQWSYNDFIKDNNLVYPTNMQAKVDVAKRRVDINITYDKLEIDKSFSIDNSISPKYTKVDFSDLIGTYIKKK